MRPRSGRISMCFPILSNLVRYIFWWLFVELCVFKSPLPLIRQCQVLSGFATGWKDPACSGALQCVFNQSCRSKWLQMILIFWVISTDTFDSSYWSSHLINGFIRSCLCQRAPFVHDGYILRFLVSSSLGIHILLLSLGTSVAFYKRLKSCWLMHPRDLDETAIYSLMWGFTCFLFRCCTIKLQGHLETESLKIWALEISTLESLSSAQSISMFINTGKDKHVWETRAVQDTINTALEKKCTALFLITIPLFLVIKFLMRLM